MRPFSFRLGRIPVTVLPAFFAVALGLGLGVLASGPSFIIAWMAIVFVSVLVHELGHATVGMAFGLEPRIALHWMGGTTSWAPHERPLATWQRIAISLAGPCAGFLTAAVIYFVIGRTSLPGTALGAFVYGQALYVNVNWGILNLVPMLPLDGGNVMAHALNGLTKGRGERPALIVSIAVAALLVPVAVVYRSWWGGALAFSFAASNWNKLKLLDAREHDEPMRESLQLAHQALDQKDSAHAIELARPVALDAKTPEFRAEALHVLALGFLLENRVADADAAIAALPEGYHPDPALVAMRANASPANLHHDMTRSPSGT
ncbi:MAG TPA: site-2 protease family protein [Polyangiaceae bacterium]|jgi:Zn-dependent protease|nr:site-2 protease family protein [Polyangiaceae bacterium]